MLAQEEKVCMLKSPREKEVWLEEQGVEEADQVHRNARKGCNAVKCSERKVRRHLPRRISSEEGRKGEV